jgi:L-asparaginase II
MSEAQPLFELTRGRILESTHYGHIAVVDSAGRLLAAYGDPETVAFLRSSAKPFQALPFVERGGVEFYGFTDRELALACASHEGSSLHIETVELMQEKSGVEESQLQCGSHLPSDPDAFRFFVSNGQVPPANYNNCSGKHTAMLAHARMRDLPLENYLENSHPIQQDILAAFADMCALEPDQVELGIDGCSAPNFAVPLRSAALGIARLCDPQALPEQRRSACRQITAAMTSHPEMISGFGEFDCELMKAFDGQVITKRGAEGFQILGLMPGVLAPGAPGVGIAFKVADGDSSRMSLELRASARVRPSVALEILSQLGALPPQVAATLEGFGPVKQITNHRGTVTGESRAVFMLDHHAGK